MARTRNLKPGFFKNEDLAECEPLTRLLFAGLWCLADRDGKLEDRPMRIKADVLPYDDCDVQAMLRQLAEKGFIERYTVNARRVIRIPTFRQHQRPHPGESPSSLPDPQRLTESREKVVVGEDFSTASCALTSFPSCIPSTLPPLPLGGGGVVPAERPPVHFLDRAFEAFMAAYPAHRRMGLRAAKAEWFQLSPGPELVGRLMDRLERDKRSKQWTKEAGQFVPRAEKWLAERPWEAGEPPRPETTLEKVERIRKEAECRKQSGTPGSPGTATSSG